VVSLEVQVQYYTHKTHNDASTMNGMAVRRVWTQNENKIELPTLRLSTLPNVSG